MYFKIFTNRLLLTSFFSFFFFSGFSQLTVTTSASAVAMAANITGTGVTVFNQVLDCSAPVACGTFTVVPGTLMGTGATVFGINSGILLTTGHATAAAGAEAGTTSFNNGFGGDPAMAALALTATTYDRCELSFDFIPKGDTIKFNYIFGSEEYIHSTCGSYDDAFAFFISGPGITGTQNMALVPGTNIPVLVNTINCGAPCVVSGWGTLSNCTSIGAGSPFTAYYTDNTGGSFFAYRGYTTKLPAIHAVTPCDTYHLKMAIVDAGNGSYDSGVFIEAGSLHSNSYVFDHFDSIGATINGIPHSIVKGCSGTSVKVIAGQTSTSGQTVHFTFSGTAGSGIDYTTIPDSATILAGDTTVTININGIPTPPGGTKTLVIHLIPPFSCGTPDSVIINIIDTPSAYILTHDTAVCGAAFQILATGSTGLVYNWTPATGLSSSTVMQPFVTPSVTTTYTMTATLPGSGCPPIVRTVTISAGSIAISMLTSDTSICLGDSVHIMVSGSAGNHYNWIPSTGLNSGTLQDPTAIPTVTTTYSVVGTLPGSGCAPDTVHVTINVGSLSASLLTHDTTICAGVSLQLLVAGSSSYVYTWSPGTGLSSATAQNPIASPSVSTTYTVTVSNPGTVCPPIVDSVHIGIQGTSISIPTPTSTICLGDSILLTVTGLGTYNYSWSPSTSLNNSTLQNPMATPTVTTVYTVTASLPGSACPPVSMTIDITVDEIIVSMITHDTTICSGNSVHIFTSGSSAYSYTWSPATWLDNPSLQNPTATPTATTSYSVTVTYPGSGCPPVTTGININVESIAINMPVADTSICTYGSVQLSVNGGTGYSYSWSPSTGLDNPNIQNPNASPTATTVYTVTALVSGSVCPPVKGTEMVTVIPPLSVGAGTEQLPCLSKSINLYGAPGGTNYSYLWTGPNSFTSTLQSPVIDSPSINSQGTYVLIVTDNTTGCGGKDSVFATFSQNITVELTHVTTNSTINYGSSIQLNADSALYYYWYPNDGTLSNPNINNPIATPVVPTTYYVVGINHIGCRDTDSVVIDISYDNIFIPSAFSPNGDGLNDMFRVRNLGYYKLVQFSVFDRYGEMVYQDIGGENKGWDGTYKGVAMDMGVYFYYIILMKPDGKQFTYKGDLTLTR